MLVGKGLPEEVEVLVQLMVTELSDTWDSLSLAWAVLEDTMFTAVLPTREDIVLGSSSLSTSCSLVNTFLASTWPRLVFVSGILFVELSHTDLGSVPA